MPNVANAKYEITAPRVVDVNQVHPDAERSNTFYEYSGRHDDGKLPILKATGCMSQVLGCLQEIKRISDEVLTDKINEMYGNGESTKSNERNDDAADDAGEEPEDDESKSKKMRLDEEEGVNSRMEE